MWTFGQKKKKNPQHKSKRKIKKGVKTAFSVLRATYIRGFLVKLKLFILTYSMDKFFTLSKEHQKLVLTSSLSYYTKSNHFLVRTQRT